MERCGGRWGGGGGGGKRTYRQGDVHADEIVRLLLQRVHPKLPFLPASGGGRSIPLQKTLPPFVGVHFRGPPSPASCRLSGGNLQNGGGTGGEIVMERAFGHRLSNTARAARRPIERK